MKQSAVEWLQEQLKDVKYNPLETNGYSNALERLYDQAKEMEKQQMIDAGNSCAIKQHLHNDMIDKMSNAEAMAFTQTDNLTFGEQYYNETFNK